MNRDGRLLPECIHMRPDPAEAESPPENVALPDQGADEMCRQMKLGDSLRVSVAKVRILF